MSRFPPNIAASAIRWIGNVERLLPHTEPREIAALCRAVIDRAMVLSTASQYATQPAIDLLLKNMLAHLAEGDPMLIALSKLPATVPEYADDLLRDHALRQVNQGPLTPKDFK